MNKLQEEALIKEDQKLKIFCSFDIESALIKNGNSYAHKANLLICNTVCDDCFDYNTLSKKNDICIKCGRFQHIFESYTCVRDFGNYLYGELAQKAEKGKGRVYVFAHNFRAYDGHFVIQDLFRRNFMNVEPIMNGSKILKIDVSPIRFIDSLSFFLQPLSALPKSFGFED